MLTTAGPAEDVSKTETKTERLQLKGILRGHALNWVSLEEAKKNANSVIPMRKLHPNVPAQQPHKQAWYDQTCGKALWKTHYALVGTTCTL